MSAGFHPNTSASAFPQQSRFAFTFQVKPGKVPKSFPWAYWISLRGLPAIFQLRLGMSRK
jgi:hypothetical protein